MANLTNLTNLDLTTAEFINSVLGLDVTGVNATGDAYVGTDSIPSSIDWRSYNGKSCVTPVKNQGSCGSCWAFATTGVIEGRVCAASNASLLTSLSEQELVSCYKQSCSGDTYFGAMNWVRTNGGLCSASEYPYTSGLLLFIYINFDQINETQVIYCKCL